MYTRLSILSVLLFGATQVFAQKADDNFSGKWKTEEGKIVIISKSSSGFTGVTADTKEAIIKDVKFSEGKWKGTIGRPGGGTKADCELVQNANELHVTARKAFFSKKLVWTKQ